MNTGKACGIFMQIESDKYTEEEKGVAICTVLKMPTHNGINKDVMLKVIKHLFDQVWDVEESK